MPLYIPTGVRDWASRVDPRSAVAATSLEATDGSARTLADVVVFSGVNSGSGGGCGTPLGSGTFGKVGTYRYHGATVAVKELKTGADKESIGTHKHVWVHLFLW